MTAISSLCFAADLFLPGLAFSYWTLTGALCALVGVAATRPLLARARARLGADASLLPVFAEGGLFSTGDGHGVQGDGEVNLTALETSLSGTFRFTVRKDMKLNNPRAETATHWITHGFDQDLDDAAKEALRDMIRLISAKTGLSAADAYMLCSLKGDLHVTQTVDGNKGIHCMMEKKLIGG